MTEGTLGEFAVCSRCGVAGHGKRACIVTVLVLDDARATVGEEFRERVRQHRKSKRMKAWRALRR